MEKVFFSKYHGTGNDFILILDDDGMLERKLDTATIQLLCDRHLGIGADGCMLLQKAGGYDFRMVYYNSDGRESTFCGNGSRCIVRFAAESGWIDRDAWFVAADGDHEAKIMDDGQIAVHMKSVSVPIQNGNGWYLDTGSPHYVEMVEAVAQLALIDRARSIRYHPEFRDAGVNVNYYSPVDAGIRIRTYERGVEDETLSCGTGVTAAALVHAHNSGFEGHQQLAVFTQGGDLKVSFRKTLHGFSDIWLTGPAVLVFKGEIDLATFRR